MGPLEAACVAVHPGASTGRALRRFSQQHPNEWFTRAELKAVLGCSDRIIREHVPDALNGSTTVIEVDTTSRTWRDRYRAA